MTSATASPRRASTRLALPTLALSLPLALDTKDTYRQIRNFLAGQWVGATRDEAMLEEVFKCLMCHMWEERHGLKGRGEAVGFTTNGSLRDRYNTVLEQLQELLPASFEQRGTMRLRDEHLKHIEAMLEGVELSHLERDPVGDLYEVFTGAVVRGQEGQFFTPQNAVELLVSLVNPRRGERVIDPACGAGGFLSATARHLAAQGAPSEAIAAHLFGVDKDEYLAGLAASHLSLVTLQKSQVFCEDSLAWPQETGFALSDQMGTFDVVLANPPFGAKIVAASPQVLRRFDLGYRWTASKKGDYVRGAALDGVPPQVLFIERCLKLARPGGRLGLVVPESLLSSRSYRHVVAYILRHAHVRAVLGMPESLFKTSGKGGTHTKTCLLLLHKREERAMVAADAQLEAQEDEFVFMAEAQWCGHDSRGKTIAHDDLPAIRAKFARWQSHQEWHQDHTGYLVPREEIVSDVLAPRYYDPNVAVELAALRETHDLIPMEQLIEDGLLRISTGDEVGKMAYGTGSIPFVRTSDISNWEVKLDPKHGVSKAIYAQYASKQDVREGDLLMVRDGTYLIGTCAYITGYDTQILFQSHLYKLRVTDPEKLSPFLLLAMLSSEPVQKQIKAKRFTQDIIDSLGDRIRELVLPFPKDPLHRDHITRTVAKAIADRVEARELARLACLQIVAPSIQVADSVAADSVAAGLSRER